MEISYKKDGNSNIMIAKNIEIEKDNYKFQMIINNEIEGIVPVSVKTVNNADELYYQITSMISLENMHAGKKMSKEELCLLIKDIEILAEKMKEYLLDINDIMFAPEFIYIKKQTGKHSFCYIFQKNKSFQEELRKLFGKILEYIDYEDKNAVLIAYEIQRIVTSDDFTIGDLVNCVKENVEKFIAVTEKNKIKEELSGVESRVEEDIVETELGKNGLLKNLPTIFRRRSRYKNEEELTKNMLYEDDFVKMPSNIKKDTELLADCETTLLTEERTLVSITLRSIDLEKAIDITPIKFPCVIGKSRKNCDFLINNPVISRVHVKITENISGYLIEDLNSTNGTFVNGMRLVPQSPIKINIGDKITLADMEFIVE